MFLTYSCPALQRAAVQGTQLARDSSSHTKAPSSTCFWPTDEMGATGAEKGARARRRNLCCCCCPLLSQAPCMAASCSTGQEQVRSGSETPSTPKSAGNSGRSRGKASVGRERGKWQRKDRKTTSPLSLAPPQPVSLLMLSPSLVPLPLLFPPW